MDISEGQGIRADPRVENDADGSGERIYAYFGIKQVIIFEYRNIYIALYHLLFTLES